MVRLRGLGQRLQHASTFYVTIAAGRAAGRRLQCARRTVVFNRVVEYPLAMVLACLARPRVRTGLPRTDACGNGCGDLLFPGVVFLLDGDPGDQPGGAGRFGDWVSLGVMIASGLGLLACVTARRRPMRFALAVAAVLAASGFSSGVSGRLAPRGAQLLRRGARDPRSRAERAPAVPRQHAARPAKPRPGARREPSTYFTRSGPIGQVFEWTRVRGWSQPGRESRSSGLGAGTLASYAQPGQRWTFYEIDPAVERIARDPRFFTYLRDCQAESLEIVLGDARLRLREAPDHAYRLIVLDAFSSDSLPVHLLSREAIGLYRSKLAEGGVLAFNLSNRYLDLDPVMGRQAADAGLVCRIGYDLDVSDEEKQAGKQPSIWAVMAAAESDLGEPG